MHAARSMLRLRGAKSTVAASAVALVAASLAAPPTTHSESAVAWTPWPPAASPPRSPYKDLRKLYRVDGVIGRGGFGQVHEGRDKRSNAPVAIKRVDKQTTSRDKFLQEVSILRAVGGRANVVGLCDAFETRDAYVLVTELVEGEELFDHLVHHGVPAEAKAQALVADIAQTLQYLHANGVVHGDLKPENILLTAQAQRVKVIDFGQSFRQHLTAERALCLGSGVATIAYAAPEVLKKSSGGSSAIDMWGLGVVLFIVLCGFHPFDRDGDATDATLAQRIAAGAFDTASAEWLALSPAAQDLVTRLLQVDPTQRPTADAVLAHAWLATA